MTCTRTAHPGPRRTRIASRLGSTLGLLGLAASALVVVTAVATVGATPAPASTAPTPLLLRERTSGLCITIPFGQSGHNPQLGPCQPTLENTFKTFTSPTDSWAVRVQLYAADACLSVPTDDGISTVPVESSHDCASFWSNYDKVKDWVEQDKSPSGYLFGRGTSDVEPNRCLTAPSPALGSSLVLMNCSALPHFFDLITLPAPPQPSHLLQYNNLNDYCLTMVNEPAPAGVRNRPCTTSSDVDHMYFVPADASFTTYRIVSRTGRCLDAYSGSGYAPSNGSEVWGTTCSRSSTWQVWQPVARDGGGFSVYNSASGLCLDTANGSYAYDAVVVVGNCRTGQLSQEWSYALWGQLPSHSLITATNGSCARPADTTFVFGSGVVVSSQPGSSCPAPWVGAWQPAFVLANLDYLTFAWAPFGVPSGNCMDGANSDVRMWACTNSSSQGWGAYRNGSYVSPLGTFTLRSYANPSQALSTSASTSLSIQPWSASAPGQQFRTY